MMEVQEHIEILELRFDVEIYCIHSATGSTQGMQISKQLIPELIEKLSKIAPPKYIKLNT